MNSRLARFVSNDSSSICRRLSSNVTGSVQGGVQHKERLVASIPLGKLSR